MSNYLWVKWVKPPQGQVKLNTDGSCLLQEGGLGYVLRDHDGSCKLAGQEYVANKTPAQCEALAMQAGLQATIMGGFSTIQVETDSLLLHDILTKDSDPLWNI